MKKLILHSLLISTLMIYAMEERSYSSRELAIMLFNQSSGWKSLVGQMSQEDLAQELFKCLAKNDEVTFCIYLELGADINAPLEPDGSRLLHKCASQGAVTSCRFLLDHGAKVDCQWKSRETALHLAAGNKQLDVCKVLLEQGAALNICNDRLNTPLHEAAIMTRAGFAMQSQHFATLYPYEAAQRVELCELMIQHQKKINESLLGTLLCFYRLKKEKHLLGTLLYNQRTTLLLPYIDAHRYVSLNLLLNMKNVEGCTPYEYLPVECLQPNRFAKKSECVVQ